MVVRTFGFRLYKERGEKRREREINETRGLNYDPMGQRG